MSGDANIAATEKALLESERRFRALIELSGVHYWEQDEHFRFTHRVGASWETGSVPYGDFVGKTRWQVPALNLTEADWARHRADLDAHREFHDLEIELPLADGRSRWISTSGRPIFDADGRFTGYRGIGRDITERKRAEEDLRRFRLAMDSSADMILLIDRKSMRYIDANPAVTRLLGYSREEILAMGPQDILPVGRRELEQSYDELIAAPGRSNVLNSRYLCKDGSELQMESSRRVLRAKDSWIIVAIARDIRDRVAAERASRESELRFRALTSFLASYFWETNADLRFTMVQGRGLAELGLSAEQMLGRRAGDISPNWRLLRPSLAEFDAIRARREPYRDVLASYRTSDGNFRYLSVWGQPIFDDDGDFQGYRGVTIDVSDRVRLEREVHELNASLELRVAERTAELEAANRELESFSYSVSHDLRAPMRVIAAFSSLIRKDYDGSLPAPAQRHFRRIEDNAIRMTQLIDDLLELSRTGRAALTRMRVDMRRLAQEVVQELLQQAAALPQISIGDLPAATGDVVLLRQVWHNLVANAVKFSQKVAAPQVEIGATREDGEDGAVRYYVRDNGAGFDMTYAEKLFGTFQRLHTPEEFEGTGVGLAIVKRIVERHGGRVGAECSPERGTTFHFSLPSG